MIMKKSILLTTISVCAPLLIGTSSAFADDSNNLTTSSTPITANFTASKDTTNPTPPSPIPNPTPDTPNPGNKPLNPQGNFALAYIPYSMNFGDIELNNSNAGLAIDKVATVAQGTTFNVGVKDTRHTTAGWHLNASLTGSLADSGASIKTSTSSSNVKKLSKDSQLVPLDNSNMITVTDNAEIGKTESTIMVGNAGNVFAGTYDLNLGEVSLHIPNTATVAAGNASGNIIWTLADTPNA